MALTTYIAHARAIGGRKGYVRTDTNALKLDLAEPGSQQAKEYSTNPEQLFACGLAASFCAALENAAHLRGMNMQDIMVQAEVHLRNVDSGHSLSALLEVTMPGISHAMSAQLADIAYHACPYSRAMRGNVPLVIYINHHTLLRAA